MLLRLAADGDCFVQAFVLTLLLVRCLVKSLRLPRRGGLTTKYVPHWNKSRRKFLPNRRNMRTDRKKNNFLRDKEQQKSVAVISWSVRVSKGIVYLKSTTRGSFIAGANHRWNL